MTLKKDDGEAAVFTAGSEIGEIGSYVLTVTATDENGKQQIKTVGFTIVGKVAPIAGNVKISGIAATGETITGTFEYTDDNGDEQGEHIFRWLSCKTKDGKFEEIKKEIKSGTTVTYVLTEAEENHYIMLEVTPVSVNEPYEGKSECCPEPFTGAMSPIAKDLKITASAEKPDKDVELTAKYEYYDENGDDPATPVIKWYSSADGKDYKEIKEASTYKLTEAEGDKYIKCSVIPVSSKAPEAGEQVYSEAYTSFFAPTAKNVKIEGTASVGQVLAAFYEYYDENGDAEGESRCEWYIGNTKIAEAPSLTLDSSLSGQTVTLKVVPVSKNYPYEGKPADGGSKTVGSAHISSSGGGTRGSSGGGGTSVKVPVENNTENKDEGASGSNTSFADTENHWAKSDIEVLVEKGILNGISENEFSPDSYLTRAQFAAIIGRIIPITEASDKEFSDVDSGAWYYDAVKKVSAAGIMNGSDGYFNPDKNITREEMCVVIANVLKYMQIAADEDNTACFADDAEISQWAKQSVNLAASLGIINGMGDNKFAPKDYATRAQTAVICNRLLNIMGGE